MRIDGTVITIPVGNCNTSRIASFFREDVQIQIILMMKYYGNIWIPSIIRFQAIALTTNYGNSFVWVGNNDEETYIDMIDLRSINEVLRHCSQTVNWGIYYESGFIDLLNTHNIISTPLLVVITVVLVLEAEVLLLRKCQLQAALAM